MPKTQINRLVGIAPIVRGLLAEPTGDDNMPYNSVILTCDIKHRAAPNKKALYLDPLRVDEDHEKTREQLQSAINAYRTENGIKPDTICLRDVGTLSVRQGHLGSGPPLRNKVALVTGAAGAIGYGICKVLIANGCYIAATDLPGQNLQCFTEDLKQLASERVIGVALDVTDKNSVRHGFETVVQAWGGVDIVVVNAGIGLVSTLKEMSIDAFRKLERVNVEGTLLTVAETARQLILQGIGGDIIIISTKNVPSPSAGFGAYSATKAACHQLGRIASLELTEYDIRVNMIAPDAVFAEGKYKSGFWQGIGADRMRARGLDEKGLHEYYRNRNLLKASITGKHVGNAVLFFATRQTPTTGATIPVDGGLPDATPR